VHSASISPSRPFLQTYFSDAEAGLFVTAPVLADDVAVRTGLFAAVVCGAATWLHRHLFVQVQNDSVDLASERHRRKTIISEGVVPAPDSSARWLVRHWDPARARRVH
jgi:hypothetical protein